VPANTKMEDQTTSTSPNTGLAAQKQNNIKLWNCFASSTQIALPVRVLSVRVFRGALRWSAQYPLRLGRPGGRPKNQAVRATSPGQTLGENWATRLYKTCAKATAPVVGALIQKTI